ncbi:Zinc/iron permease family-containing protein [Strongyloides ratti]|uniref:Zinc/iron permease family-containing protein n=1 Tax=Strongyloides ratti TaxID=34506 RepID=A0A090L9U5_STRRB|nr:Zinc/iron permease family-containing protein [Strongyloides ratti]CEF64255.1 Zinc/iron permease family-containing protein [Strongyloides ratti]
MNDTIPFSHILNINETHLPEHSQALAAAIFPKQFSYDFEEEPEPQLWETWLYGLSLATCSGFAAPIGITLVPLLPKQIYERIMTFLVALGIGAMSASCIFLLIPQAFQITSLHSFRYTHKCWFILIAIYVFFTIDRALQFYVAIKRKRNKRHVHIKTIAAIINPFNNNNKKNISKTNGERRKSILKNTNNNTSNGVSDNQVIDVDGDEYDTTSLHSKNNEYSNQTITSENSTVYKNTDCSNLYDYTKTPLPSYKSDDEDDNFDNSMIKKEWQNIQNDLNIATLGNAFVRTLSQRRRVGIIREEQIHLDSITFNSNDNKSIILNNNTSSNNLPIKKDYDDKMSLDVCVDVVEKKVLNTSSLEISTVVYMILFGGAANNFVDGMSTGAAFSDSIQKGFSIGLAVLSQQFPQELGTLAIMIKSGLGLKKTLLFNLIPIFMGYAGFSAGVILDNINDTFDDEVFAVSAGMYCYIFLGTLVPELRDGFNEILEKSLIEASLVNALQYIGFVTGIGLMYIISIFGND